MSPEKMREIEVYELNAQLTALPGVEAAGIEAGGFLF